MLRAFIGWITIGCFTSGIVSLREDPRETIEASRDKIVWSRGAWAAYIYILSVILWPVFWCYMVQDAYAWIRRRTG